MSGVLMLFLDGVGLGQARNENPFYRLQTEYLPFWEGAPLPKGGVLLPLSPELQVPGTPQSATGQATLYTGTSCASLLGHHLSGYPNQMLRRVILERGLFQLWRKRGGHPLFINAYPDHEALFSPPHLDLGGDGCWCFSPDFPAPFRRRLSVTTTLMRADGQRPGGRREMAEGRALYQDFSCRNPHTRELALPRVSPAEAAAILRGALARHDLVLFEYFQTDVMAHRGSSAQQEAVLGDLNELLGELWQTWDTDRHLLLVISDHGNMESSTKGHSRNPVPLLLLGQGATELSSCRALKDVSPSLLRLRGPGGGPPSQSPLPEKACGSAVPT